MNDLPPRAPAPDGDTEAEEDAAATPAAGTDVPLRPPSTATSAHPREEEIERSFDRIIEEGRARLRRRWLDVLATGTVGGLEVAFGVLALLVVVNQTQSPLLGGLAFSIGFIGLRLGHSELFTEGFLVPVTVVAAGDARLRDLGRLWIGTLVGNLAGGAVMAWLIDEAFPSLQHTAVKAAAYYVGAGINGRTFCLAVIAGGAITLLTRMHQGTDSEVAKLIASIAVAFLLAGVRLFHSVLDSLLAFVALGTGHATFGWLAWLGFFGWVLVGNMVGGLVLTTLLRLVRSRARITDHRLANDRRPVPGVRT
jgi:formate/nitrite transporter FocA (FNT family)